MITYKDYIIESELEPWALKFNYNFRYYISEESIHHASTLEEALQDIDDRTNSYSWPVMTSEDNIYPFEELIDALQFCQKFQGLPLFTFNSI